MPLKVIHKRKPVPEPNSQPQADSQPKKAQRRKPQSTMFFGRRWSKMALVLVGVSLLSATGGAMLAVSLASKPLQQHQLSPEEDTVFSSDRLSNSNLQLPSLTRSVNLLVLGMSVLPDDLKEPSPETKDLSYEPQMHSVEGQSDTILLLRFDPEKNKMVVLSVPRDTQIILGKYGVQKINNANVVGGAARAASEVSKLLNGVNIDRYVRVNVLGVGKLIDILGGLTIDVPKDMKYTDETQHLFVDLKQGRQHLNGDQVMQLLRFRHDLYGDLGRMQRQQLVIRALISEMINPSTIAKIPQLLQSLKSDIDTNLSIEELMALVGFAARRNHDQIQGLIVPGDFNGDGHHSISYWLPDEDRIQLMMAKYFDTGAAGREVTDLASMRVSIQDGTNNPKAVKALVNMLRASGFHNISVDAPVTKPVLETKIVAQKGDIESANSINQVLKFGQVSVETSGTLYSDVTIQLGQDALPRLVEVDKTSTY